MALQQQALELTETELIRSKARLKGIETKAEASSAIAEARILLRRLGASSAAAALCQESLAKAEQAARRRELRRRHVLRAQGPGHRQPGLGRPASPLSQAPSPGWGSGPSRRGAPPSSPACATRSRPRAFAT